MARSDKLYDKSPKLERGSDDKVAVKKGSDKKKGSDDTGEPDDSPIPGSNPMKEMHERHINEMKDMHKRHQKEAEKFSDAADEGDKKSEKE